jgi:predicted dinucleotide-binding enzyme
MRPEPVKAGAININTDRKSNMSYAIVGFGAVGQALARMFARKGIEVAVASRRPPEALAPQARAIGPTVAPKALQDAIKADAIILAVPFWEHREVASALASWQGKIVIDVTNAFGVPVDDLGGLPSSTVIARALPGARLVKAFNHLPAGVLAQDPATAGGRRVIFLSSDDEGATATVAALVEQLGYAPVGLGKIAEGGQLVQARDKSWAPLIFQDLFKKEQ